MLTPIFEADLQPEQYTRPVSKAANPGGTQESADACISALRPRGGSPASAPLFRPVTTDVKGERRFIATIARRLDSLGAITRGQRDSQTAMGGDGQALFRESDNLESLYAKAALRRFYIALWRGNIPGWSLDRFEDATGLKLVHEGNLKEDLPPMPRFLNRLLALPIDEQNQLFAELEERIAANIEQAMEAGAYEVGVETVRADSLAVAGRETLYEHPGTGAVTELVEIIRRGAPPTGLPVLLPSPSSMRAAATTPAEPADARVARFPAGGSLPRQKGGSASALLVSGPAQRSLALQPAWSLSRPRRPRYIGVLQAMSLPPSPAPIATGWSDSCRAGFAPARRRRLSTAHRPTRATSTARAARRSTRPNGTGS